MAFDGFTSRETAVSALERMSYSANVFGQIHNPSQLVEKLARCIRSGIFTFDQAYGVYRCCVYNAAIPDISIGSIWREDVNAMLNRKGI